ncbi:hypothetical protein J2S43_006719 [Catenuloplanes nepalensis]|uniref:Lipoprotein n=1 Tax=Catenuloplanes nepalensis TaxID=587533 RepID=A0ABT9N3C2_9ACTN|nr:hypothetical protein [Catenuloplanes nepalensis]MDP9798207.1 hypothetical protein [Catenuloplanes nepalensis]
MTRSMTVGRRALRLAVGAAAVALAVTGCSAGQIAETAMKAPSVASVSADSADGKLAVRGLAVAYEGVEGYPAGGNAPVHVTLINQTANPMTVAIGIGAPAEGANPTVTTARAVQIVGGGSPSAPAETSPSAETSAGASPSGSPSADAGEEPETPGSASPDASGSASGGAASASPSQTSAATAPAGRAATVEIPANSAVIFTSESAERLTLVGLAAALRSGMSVTLTFQATEEGGAASELLTVPTPVDIPLTPAPRETPHEEEGEGH